MYEYDDDGSVPVNILENKDQRTDPYSFDEVGNVTLAGITEVEQHLTTKGEPKQQNSGITLLLCLVLHQNVFTFSIFHMIHPYMYSLFQCRIKQAELNIIYYYYRFTFTCRGGEG